MPSLLQIQTFMNSAVEDVLDFRTCCSLKAFDQNLEIHITNRGDRSLQVPSFFDLKGEFGTQRVNTLLPQGEQSLAPGRTIAFYCTMDEKQWERARQIVFYDIRGNAYSTDIDA
jgi:hypothetical protein